MKTEIVSLPITFILRPLLGYFRFSQLVPAIFVQGLAILLAFTSLLIASQETGMGEGLFQQILRFFGAENLRISSSNEGFWETMIFAYLFLTLLFDLAGWLLRRFRTHPVQEKSFWQRFRLWLILPTLAFLSLLGSAAISNLGPDTSFGQILLSISGLYLLGFIITFYSLSVDVFLKKIERALR